MSEQMDATLNGAKLGDIVECGGCGENRLAVLEIVSEPDTGGQPYQKSTSNTMLPVETLEGLGISKIRAERRAGEMLGEMDKNKGARGVGVPFHDDTAPTYDELGISRLQSHRWQLEADVPEAQLEQLDILEGGK